MNNRVHIPSDKTLISLTDTLGVITNASDDFVDISGYSRNELVGSPHNIIRHPDTPSIVFEDFWNTIQNKQEWQQPIKNLTKNGDYYWVNSTTTAILDDDEIVGYRSIRTPMNDEEIEEAEQLYSKLQSGELSISQGVICSPSKRFIDRHQLTIGSISMVLIILVSTSAWFLIKDTDNIEAIQAPAAQVIQVSTNDPVMELIANYIDTSAMQNIADSHPVHYEIEYIDEQATRDVLEETTELRQLKRELSRFQRLLHELNCALEKQQEEKIQITQLRLKNSNQSIRRLYLKVKAQYSQYSAESIKHEYQEANQSSHPPSSKL